MREGAAQDQAKLPVQEVRGDSDALARRTGDVCMCMCIRVVDILVLCYMRAGMLIDKMKCPGRLKKNVRAIIHSVHDDWVKIKFKLPHSTTWTYERVMHQRQEFTSYGTRYYREGMPLRLVFAITVHAAQGQTVDRLITMLNKKLFEWGQGYVAVSRVSSLRRLLAQVVSTYAVSRRCRTHSSCQTRTA